MHTSLKQPTLETQCIGGDTRYEQFSREHNMNTSTYRKLHEFKIIFVVRVCGKSSDHRIWGPTGSFTKVPLVGFIGDQRGAAWVQLVISLTMAIIGMPLLMSIEESVENPKFLASNSIWCYSGDFHTTERPHK